jgi:P27 family predicted phage terminase small subunit
MPTGRPVISPQILVFKTTCPLRTKIRRFSVLKFVSILGGLYNMGKRGPFPKSNADRILEGNPSKRPLREETPRPQRDTPNCPAWLSPSAKAEWKRLTPELSRLGLLNRLDRNILASYCSTFALWRQNQEVLSTQGSVYVTAKGVMQPRPELAVVKATAEMLQKFSAELGLSPSSRLRLEIPNPNEEVDPMEEFLNSGRMT